MTVVKSYLEEGPEEHILMFAYSFYGHQKPMCDLAVKIVRTRSVYVTILVGDQLFDTLQKYILKQFDTENECHLYSLIRIVGMDCGRSSFDSTSTNRAFASAFKQLYDQNAIRRRPVNDHVYGALSTPKIVILDLLGWEAMQTIRSVGGTHIRVFVLQSSMAAQVFLMSAPKKLGGRGDFATELELAAENTEVDIKGIENFAQQLWERTDGKIIRGAGLPDFYDHELYPQTSVFDDNVSVAYMTRYMHRLFNTCDGMILNTSKSIEPLAVIAWEQWLKNRPLFVLGPLAPPVTDHVVPEESQDIYNDVELFLNNALKIHGESSVIYISFGTVFWTTEPEKVWAVFDILIEMNIPFIFAYASAVAELPKNVREKAQASGLAYISKWVPQHFVLHHRATGWFLSHCGQNSMLESLMEGVPMICWPYRGDQPCSAMNLTVNLNVAYELFEVRNGKLGLSPLIRLGNMSPSGTVEAVRREVRDILRKAIGEDGKIKRMNAEQIGAELVRSWNIGNVCHAELVKLLSYLDA